MSMKKNLRTFCFVSLVLLLLASCSRIDRRREPGVILAEPTATPAVTSDPFWQEWQEAEDEIGDWLEGEPTIPAEDIP